MMKVLVVFAAVLVIAQAYNLFHADKAHWDKYKLTHSKTYKEEEEERRMEIFFDNSRKVAEHNERYERGLVSYKLDINVFADMEHGEFVQTFNGLNMSLSKTVTSLLARSNFVWPTNIRLPSSMDWRQQGAVTAVKNQGHCGSCWSFSATGSLEGQWFRKTGNLVSLSEQNLIDCSKSYGTMGCHGGIMELAFQYIKDNRGIDTESSYPYEETNDVPCRYNAKFNTAVDTGYVDIPQADEEALQVALATVGPISVAIDASHPSFQLYNQGIYYEPDCGSAPENLNHGVLAVGYGSEDGQDYWIVKNSWSTMWGEMGYIRIRRNANNHCGIATHASYPLV